MKITGLMFKVGHVLVSDWVKEDGEQMRKRKVEGKER